MFWGRLRRAVVLPVTVALVAAGAVVATAPTVADAAQSPTSCTAPLSLVNGSFESPSIPAHSFADLSDSTGLATGLPVVPGWTTTESDHEIEYWSNGFTDGISGNSYNADDGTQWAELNANAASTLYQTVNTSAYEGKTVQWRVSHRGRASATVGDVMNVLIGSTLGSATAQKPTGATSTNISDTDVAWGHYSGSYFIPNGQASTVFAFQAVSSATGDAAVGNFLDNISFGTAPCVIDTKTVTDTSRASGLAQVGDTLQYTVTSANQGGTPADQSVTTDTLPAGLTFVPGSLSVTNDGVTTAATDTSGDDVAEYNSATRTVTARLGTGASASAGGSIQAGVSSSVTFRAAINSNGPIPLTNSAATRYFDSLDNTSVTATSNTTTTAVQNVVTAVADPASTNAGAPVTTSVLTNDTVLNGGAGLDQTSVAISTPASNGTAVANSDGTVTYTPNAHFSGTDSYQYTVCDTSSPRVCSTPASVTVTVDNVFVDGLAATSGVSTDQNTAVTTPLSSIAHTVGAPLDQTKVTQLQPPSDGTLSIDSSGDVTYTPNANFSGSDSYQVQVCDTATPSQCDPVTVPVTVGVNAVNAVDDADSTDEGAPVTTTVLGNDTVSTGGAGLNPASVSITSGPSHGSVLVHPNGTVTYTPTAGFSGTDTYHYKVCDQSTPTPACSAPATVTVTVANDFIGMASDPPTAQNTPLTLPLSSIATTTGAPLDQTKVTQALAPSNGTLSIDHVSGAVTYTPDANYSGPDSYQVQVCDTSSPSQCHDVIVAVTVENNVVTAVADPASTNAGAPVTTSVLTNDTVLNGGAGLDQTSVAISTPATNGHAVPNSDGTVTYTPNPGFSGTDSYDYTVCDLSTPTPICSAPATVTVTVNNVYTPGPASSSYTAPGGGTGGVNTPQNVPTAIALSSIVTTGGLDPTSAIIPSGSAPTHGSVAIAPDGHGSFTVTYTPQANYTGPDSFAVYACDANTECSVIPVLVTTGTNQLAAADDTATVAGYSSAASPNRVTTAVLSNDHSALATSTPSGLILGAPINPNSLTIVSGPANGSAAVQPDGTVVYTPNANFSGTDSYRYQVCDTSTPTPMCATATVTVAVTSLATLAFTGSVVTPTLIAAAALLLMGLLMMLISARPRRRPAHRG